MAGTLRENARLLVAITVVELRKKYAVRSWLVAGLGVALPDVSYFINLFMFLLMFVSPVAFKPDMVPASLQFVIYGNPVHYMLEVFRDCLIAGRPIDLRIWAAHLVISMALFVLGAGFFRTFKSVLVDYE